MSDDVAATSAAMLTADTRACPPFLALVLEYKLSLLTLCLWLQLMDEHNPVEGGSNT